MNTDPDVRVVLRTSYIKDEKKFLKYYKINWQWPPFGEDRIVVMTATPNSYFTDTGIQRVVKRMQILYNIT
jgi:hypothetical protein